MFKTAIVSALALAATAGAAAAMDAPSQGAAMLARINGVAPGAYEVSDLVRLGEARRSVDEGHVVRHILDRGRTGIAGRAATAGAGAEAAQLARSVGEAPGRLGIDELAALDAAQSEANADHVARFISGGGLRADTGDSRGSGAARAQIAAALNLDAADFTLAQLVRLDLAAQENDAFTIRAILDEAGVARSAGDILR